MVALEEATKSLQTFEKNIDEEREQEVWKDEENYVIEEAENEKEKNKVE